MFFSHRKTEEKTSGKDVRAYFDAWADSYDKNLSAYHYGLPDKLSLLRKRHLPADKSLKLLAAGIGTGLTVPARDEPGNFHITGMDISPRMIDICSTKKIADDLYHHNAAQTPWPFPDKQFDIVQAAGLIEYIKTPLRFLKEAGRVLKMGGLAIITYETPQSLPLYHGGLIAGVTARTDKYTQIRRRNAQSLFWPKFYMKYLHEHSAICAASQQAGLKIIDTAKDFPAYVWPALKTSETRRPVHHDILVLKAAG